MERVRSGGVRWEVALHFKTGDAVTVGWMTKRGGWALVEGGIAALEKFSTADQLYGELQRLGHKVAAQRKQALRVLSDAEQFIARALDVVEAGQWTAHADLAEIVGTTAAEVARRSRAGRRPGRSSPASRSRSGNLSRSRAVPPFDASFC
jgi:5-methylcytosine-specific restriction enzyme B